MPSSDTRPLQGVLLVIAAVALFACFDTGVKIASALAPVGVLLSVMGYALGTYGAYITGIVLRAMAS